jgi:GNAT superfamily N-acetyltransferase
MAVGGGRDFAPLTAVLQRLDGSDARLGGGWGIDVLAGRVTRTHHDVDLFVPEEALSVAAGRLASAGWRVVGDDRPWRMVLTAPDGGQVDLGGLRYRPDGHAVQVDGDGDLELFPAWAWTQQMADGSPVVCLTAEAQRMKHRGYPGRSGDAPDLAVIAHLDDPACFDPRVWTVPPGVEEELLDGIETASDLLVRPYGLWPLPPMTAEEAAAEAARTVATLAVGRPPVGFCRVELVDGHPHIGQLSVLAEYGRRGLGRSLLASACRWAEQHGHRQVTLTTFADIPFNAPFYRRAGFVDMTVTPGTELSDVVAHEADLARLGPRAVMFRVVVVG